MKRYLLLPLLSSAALLAHAQVDNYALKFNGESTVNCFQMPELKGLDTYTFQFWMSPDQWVKGSTVFSVGPAGDKVVLQLGDTGTLLFTVGDKTATISSADLSGAWSQISIVNTPAQLTVWVNNRQVVAGADPMPLPQITSDFKIGERFSGRLDELRIWSAAVSEEYLLWQNTLNSFHPDYEELIAYYKFDQYKCPDIVDYTYRHHGEINGTVTRETVNDNPFLVYKVLSAYTNFTRFFDRANIITENYLMCNDLLVLDIATSAEGRAWMSNPDNSGKLTNADYLSEYQSRTGVLSLKGNGARMEVGPDAISIKDGGDELYAFATWIYLEEWTEGAFLFRKEESENKGFSVRLGRESDKEVIVRINGEEYISKTNGTKQRMETGKWIHFGVSTTSKTTRPEAQKAFCFFYEGKGYWAEVHPQQRPNTSSIPFTATRAVIGENLHAKLDQTSVWDKERTEGDMRGERIGGIPMPGPGSEIPEINQFSCNSYWTYDREENPGHDFYSYTEFLNIMRSAFGGKSGYTLRLGIKGHGGWTSTLQNAAKRESMANDIAEIVRTTGADGVETDFEWAYGNSEVTGYSDFIELLKQKMPDKIVSSSPHAVCYNLKQNALNAADRFSFQVYTNRNWFIYDEYVNAYNAFRNFGYPDQKIVMSYGATTSMGDNGSPENGYKSVIGYDPRPDVESITVNGINYMVCSVNQVKKRAQFVLDRNIAGLMYWDMGNDLPATDELSLCRAVNYVISSNLDSLVTEVSFVDTGILENKTAQNDRLTLYPNPTKGLVTVKVPQGEQLETISVFTLSGTLSREIEIPVMAESFTADCSMLEKGTYLVVVKSKTGSRYTQRMLVD